MKMLKDSLWANGSALLTQLIALGTTLVVARFVGPADYGLVATGLVILLFFQRFLLESFGFSIIRETKDYEGYVESANYCSIVFGYISNIIMLIAAFILYIYSYQDLAIVIIALSVIPVLDGYSTIRTCILRKDGKFKQLAGRVLIANTSAGIFAILLAINNFGIWALIGQQVVLAVCNLLISYKYANWKPLDKVSKVNIRKIMKFGFPMMGNSVVFVAANRVDVLFLSFLSNPINVGIYSMSRRITRTIPDILVNGSNSVLFTYLRKESEETGLILTFKTIIYIFLLIIPLLCFIYIYSFYLVDIIFGSAWSELNFSLVIQSLLCTSVFQIFISLINTYYLSINMSKKVFLLNTFQLLIFVISMSTYLFFGDFSALVVAKCFFLSNFITVLLVLLHLTWSKFDNLILLINVIFKFIPIWIGVFVLFYLLNMVGFSLISIVILIICYLLIFMYVYFLEKELRVYLLRFFGRV